MYLDTVRRRCRDVRRACLARWEHQMNEEFRPGSKIPTVWEQIEVAISQKHDLPPAPKRMSYLICSSSRTGSNLLCAALWTTQMAGRPFEYLHPAAIAAYRRRIGA